MFALLICILTLVPSEYAAASADICTENTEVQDEIVDVHNEFRRAVQPTASDMLSMSYSEELADTIQTWVDHCIIGHGPVSSRMINGYQLGENLFYSTKIYSWTDVISAWHSEVENYKYPNGSMNGKEVGHYVQVVWNSSYKVGCGVALCPNDIYFYGCHYYRAGNFHGWPPYKVGPPCASCPNNCVDNLCTNPCPYINTYMNCPALSIEHGCWHTQVYDWCHGSCKCKDEIIPIA
ncbi:hypothetical protein PAMA_015562 [Pampus argenteus]